MHTRARASAGCLSAVTLAQCLFDNTAVCYHAAQQRLYFRAATLAFEAACLHWLSVACTLSLRLLLLRVLLLQGQGVPGAHLQQHRHPVIHPVLDDLL